MKTPEQMAEEYGFKFCWSEDSGWAMTMTRDAFLAGYQAAKDTYKDAIETYEDVAKQMLEEAVRIMSPKDQLADADKVMPQWISVKERLPEEGLEVLIFGKILNDISKILGVRARFNGDQSWKYTWESEDIHIYTQDDVTHWMPLVDAPKEEA